MIDDSESVRKILTEACFPAAMQQVHDFGLNSNFGASIIKNYGR